MTNGRFSVLELLHLSTDNRSIEMNLAMRILFSTCIIFLFAVASSMAQTPTRKPVGKTQTSIAPATGSKPRITTPPPKTADRSAGTKAPTERSTTAPTSSSRVANQGGSLKPSPTSLRNTAISRPAAQQNPSDKLTAKGVPRQSKRTPPIKATEKVNVQWMTLEQAIEKNKTEKRKIFVDVYTDWCGWCKHMDSTTFVTPVVANYLNEHYYAVKFNAEQTQEIIFKDKTYRFNKIGNRGHHELAALWLNNRLSFPTVVFLDENQNLIQPVPGYLDETKMQAIINYFGTDSHRKMPWETYEKNFSGQHK